MKETMIRNKEDKGEEMAKLKKKLEVKYLLSFFFSHIIYSFKLVIP